MEDPKTERGMVEILHDLDKNQALLTQEFRWMREYLEKSDFVHRSEFIVIQRVVYGVIGLILAGVFGALIRLVLIP